MVTTPGRGMTLLYHLLIPFFWCIPIFPRRRGTHYAMPVQGGFYRWVRAAFGDFWDSSPAVNWSASFFSVASTPCSRRLSRLLFPTTHGPIHYLVAAALIDVHHLHQRGVGIQMVKAASQLCSKFSSCYPSL